MGMKPSGRKGFNPVAAAGIDIGAMMTAPSAAITPTDEAAAVDSLLAEERVEERTSIAPPGELPSLAVRSAPAAVQHAVVTEEPTRAAVPLVAQVANAVAAQLDVSDKSEPAMAPKAAVARPSRSARRSNYEPGAVEVTLTAGKAPESGRYLWHIDQTVFTAAERERTSRNIPTWGEYFIAVLAQHARELDTLFPSLGYDLDVFGLGVMARRGYRKHDQPTAVAAVYLPKTAQGKGLAEVIETYAARARSKSAFAQQLVEHHLKVEGLL
jgi:hypothetical protein